jgi:hypothetical protein
LRPNRPITTRRGVDCDGLLEQLQRLLAAARARRHPARLGEELRALLLVSAELHSAPQQALGGLGRAYRSSPLGGADQCGECGRTQIVGVRVARGGPVCVEEMGRDHLDHVLAVVRERLPQVLGGREVQRAPVAARDHLVRDRPEQPLAEHVLAAFR